MVHMIWGVGFRIHGDPMLPQLPGYTKLIRVGAKELLGLRFGVWSLGFSVWV